MMDTSQKRDTLFAIQISNMCVYNDTA